MAAAVVVPAVVLQLVNLLVIGFVLTVQGSTGDSMAPGPSFFPKIPPLEGTPGTVHDRKPWKSSAPNPAYEQNGSSLHPPNAVPPVMGAPVPETVIGSLPAHSPETPTPIVTPPLIASPPPLIIQGHVPSLSPAISIISPAHDNPGSTFHTSPALSPLIPAPDPPTVRGFVPSSSHVTPIVTPPNSIPPLPFVPPFSIAPPPLLPPNSVSPPPSNFPGHVPSLSPTIPIESPPNSIAPPPLLSGRHAQPLPQNASRRGAPVRKSADSAPAAAPSGSFPQISPVMHPGARRSSQPGVHSRHVSLHGASSPKPNSQGQNGSHASTPPSNHLAKGGAPVAAPPHKASQPPSSADNSSPKAPSKSVRHSSDAPAPSLSIHISPQNNGSNSTAPSPHHRYHIGNKNNASSPQQSHERNKTSSILPAPSYPTSPTSSEEQGPVSPPSFLPTNGHTRYAPPPLSLGSPSTSVSPHPSTKPVSYVSPVPSPSPIPSSGWTTMPVHPPEVSPASSPISPKKPLPVQALPPPPPNEDCSSTVCTEPYTNTPPGSPCGCVLPVQVGLRLSVALYTFFPLVSELAQEIAAGVFMKLSQVRIIGANAASQEPEKTVVLVDLVPLGKRFDNTTAFFTYHRFWHKEVVIKAEFFGDYEVLYVRYQGLPPSPPMAPSGIGIVDGVPYSDNGNNGRAIKPFGVDVSKRQHKDGLGGGMIAIITLSGFVALVLCSAVVWFFVSRQRDHNSQPIPSLSFPSHAAKPPGTLGSAMGSGLSSASLSFGSSIATYAGSAKTFSTSELERATNNFDASRILGEGGFGLVYRGVLEDGTEIAVKILKRDDQQGGREFLAEVEMLSRLHHRNLVKLIGICTEERARSLVYELIPNGSVESHLHGIDKEAAPLNWDARMKIALGAARGLAYLHEDSSPRVIHRDFKGSNILLEHDFTPKVSDFGLARTAMDEASTHISTRVMGTFGYVAPEYAMTGHLLVKSDVYSYGVVLLELLSGRKPVDMSQPAGQENLVAWARPLLTSKEGLEIMVDPSLGPEVPFDSVAKVAAIASMCVQPEVSNRPFMGEVVQALKLVCNECDEAKRGGSRSSSRDMSADMDGGVSSTSGQLPDPFQNRTQVPNYDSESDIERGLPMSSDMYATSERYSRQGPGSFKRCSSSGPSTAGKSRQLWQRLRGLTGGSVSEHGAIFKSWSGSH